ncbi:MAG: desulfoferrodoxin FeS4 iron-binding domain-containing protein [Patescibacteria group bacterium]|nr:desulfoferrodoxin FeS4 iron-binding domain-containing protein [Patescibacteria group bacterium]
MSTEEIGQVFVCQVCGNEVTITRVGEGTLTCCGKPMLLKEE